MNTNEELIPVLQDKKSNIEAILEKIKEQSFLTTPFETLGEYEILRKYDPAGIRKIYEEFELVNKAILEKYQQLVDSGAKDANGKLVTEALGQQTSISWSSQKFEGGEIRYNPEEKKAFVIYGAIYAKWVQLGGVNFGLPVTDESVAMDGKGRYNHFSRGKSIYWHPAIGAFAIYGEIRNKWASLGWENSFLGYPLTDEFPAAGGLGRCNHFQNGSIYWTPGTGAHEVHGSIRDKWDALGGTFSFLGYPVSDEINTVAPAGGRVSNFQRGFIVWNSNGSVTVTADAITWRSGKLGPDTTEGFAEFSVSSDGNWNYKGHMHESGWFSHDAKFGVAVVLPETGIAIGVAEEGTIHGTVDPGTRDYDWDKTGFDERIIKHFDLLRTKGATFNMDVSTTPLSIFFTAMIPVVVALIILGGVKIGTDPACKSGHHENPDGSSFDGWRCEYK